MLRSAPMAVLSSPVSRRLWPRCAVADSLGMAPALRPEPRARRMRSWRRPALVSASWDILASVRAPTTRRHDLQYWPTLYGWQAKLDLHQAVRTRSAG